MGEKSSQIWPIYLRGELCQKKKKNNQKNKTASNVINLWLLSMDLSLCYSYFYIASLPQFQYVLVYSTSA